MLGNDDDDDDVERIQKYKNNKKFFIHCRHVYSAYMRIITHIEHTSAADQATSETAVIVCSRTFR